MSVSVSPLERFAATATRPAPIVSRSPGVCAEVLRTAIPELALGLWRLDSLDVGASWRHKQTVLISLTAVVTSYSRGTSQRLSLLLKVDPQQGGWHTDRASLAMRAAGLDGPPAAVMRTYGVDQAGTLVCQNVGGRVWDTLLKGSLAWPCVRQVAQFLVTLQASNAVLPDGPTLIAETTRELTELAQLASEDSTLHRQIVRLGEYLVPGLDPAVPLPLVPGHGDLHTRNIVFSIDNLSDSATVVPLTAIDLDHAGRYEPALDVGYAIAHVIVRARRADIDPPGALRLAGALWDEYGAAGGRADDERVAIQAARALTQVLHYELIGMGGGPLDALPAWSGLALQLLESGRAALGLGRPK